MQKADDHDELPLVMDEIKLIMGARGTALTLHPDDSEKPEVIFADQTAGLSRDLVDGLSVEHVRWDEADSADASRWITCAVDDSCEDILLIPVRTIPGHSRLLIHVYFDHLTDDKRDQADRIYNQRKPFAVGYFRLWQLSRTRARETASLKAALNLTDMAVMLVDRSAQLTFVNRAARDMLLDGSGLRVRKNTVRASRLSDSVRLQVAIEHVIAANGAHGGNGNGKIHAPLLSLERHGAPPLIVSVLPSEDRATEPNDIAAVIYASDPSRNMQDMLASICKIYRLSPVETRLACKLIAGATLAEAAKNMRIKEMTARSYLKQIFLKTSTHRQGELIQLMLSSIIRTTPTIVSEPVGAL